MVDIFSHCIYRHYKGKLYYVVGLAQHTETEELMVVYHALYGDNEMYVRPAWMFTERAPKTEQNVTGQELRFELAQDI